MDKLKMHSPDITQENIEKIQELFPGCVTEARDDKGNLTLAVDFDQLRQELSGNIVEGMQERYQLTWPGKNEALATSNLPTSQALRPCRSESVSFDDTQNLFIEGDNLEVLKLLQEIYLGQVKMIYIDPPYNTGNDFIYNDDFSEKTSSFLERSGQYSGSGERFVANPSSKGRFHSAWLSMIYSRLRLAKNLMAENGVIFISIDDKEHANLMKVCSEIFGTENFVGNIVWKNVTDNNPTNVAIEHEYVVVFAKSKLSLEKIWKSKVSLSKDVLVSIGHELVKTHKDPEELQEAYSRWFRDHKHELWPLENYKFIDAQGVYSGERGVHNPGKEGYRYDILHPITGKPCKEPLMGYRFPEETMNKMIEEERIIFGDDEDKLVEIKVYAADYKQKLSSVFNLDGRSGANELKELFPEAGKIFTNPKTIKLLTELISFASSDGDLILDFFAGSGSTAHAVLELNAAVGENRRFISVQLDEPTFEIVNDVEKGRTGPAGEAFKRGYKSISDVAKERIRRAGQRLLETSQHDTWRKDIGFRVLKVDSSNMHEVYYTPDQTKQSDLLDAVDNLKTDRTPEDLLFQVLTEWGVDLTLPISSETLQGKQVFFVDDNALVACFDKDITEEIVHELANREPLRVVFRDNGFVSDSVKINVEQIFKQLSPMTDVKAI